MALSPTARWLLWAFVGLAALFSIALLIVWLYQDEHWDPTSVLIAVTVFGAGGVVLFGFLSRFRERVPPPPPQYQASHEPVPYIR